MAKAAEARRAEEVKSCDALMAENEASKARDDAGVAAVDHDVDKKMAAHWAKHAADKENGGILKAGSSAGIYRARP